MILEEYDRLLELKRARDEAAAEGRAAGREAGHAEGRAEGVMTSLRNLVANQPMELSQAFDLLGIEEADRPHYEQLLAAQG